MRARAVLAIAVSAAILFTVPADAAPTAPHWRASPTPNPVNPGALNQIAIAGPKLAWAGGIEGRGTALWLWNGKKWLRSRTPKPFVPTTLAVTNATHAWAGGIDIHGSQAVFWNGKKWTKVGYYGIPIDMSAGKDGAAFSVSSDVLGGKTRLLGWSRKAWRTVQTPAPVGSTLSSVSVRTRNDVWIGGTSPQGPLLMHWNGHTWRRFTFPASQIENGNIIHKIVAVSRTQVWALRGTTPTSLMSWNGTAWTERELPGKVGSLAVSSDGKGGAWVLPYALSSDTRTTYLHWTGGTWVRFLGPERHGHPGLGDLEVIPGSTKVVSVGGLQLTPQGRPKIPFFETYH
jgi:hypothetical protein